MKERELEQFVIDESKRGINIDDMGDRLISFSNRTGSIINKLNVSDYDIDVINEIYKDDFSINRKIPTIDELTWGIEQYNEEVIRECIAIDTASQYGTSISESDLLDLIEERVEYELNNLNDYDSYHDSLIAKACTERTTYPFMGQIEIDANSIESFLMNCFECEFLESSKSSAIGKIADDLTQRGVSLFVGSDRQIINKSLLEFGIAKVGSEYLFFPQEVEL